MSEDSDEDWFERALSADDSEDEDRPDDSADPEDSRSPDDDGADADAEMTGGGSWMDTDPSPGEETADPDAGGIGGGSWMDADSDTDSAEDGGGSWMDSGDESAFGGEEFDDGGAAASAGGPDEGGLFDDDGFASAFEGGGGSEFEEEEFESEIPRIDLGIEGLDNMIQGGIPERHLIVTIGGAGTGKTTFGLQFLRHGLIQGEKAVFITLEQSREAIVATANEFGWDFESFEAENRLAVVDLDPVEMANSLDNIQAELPELIRGFGADRLVLDSVSLLEMMYDDQAKRRTEVFDFTRALKKAGVTTFLTSEASESNPYASRHGIIEYLTDAVFVLQYIRGETQETRLAVEIQKIRNANHSREMKPYEMTDSGLSVYQQANIF
jgi:KaiC domain protein